MALDESSQDGTSSEGSVESAAETREERGMLADLKRERERRQELAREIAQMKAEQEARTLEEAERNNEFKRLYEEHAPYKAKYEQLAAERQSRLDRLTQRNAERVELLPDHLKALSPALQDPEAMAEWLDKASKAATETRVPSGTNTGAGVPKGGIPAECVAEAKRIGRDPEYWYRTGWQKRKTT